LSPCFLAPTPLVDALFKSNIARRLALRWRAKAETRARFWSLCVNPLYDIEVKTIEGETTRLDAFAGKAMVVVNVASQCGFTPQYAGLETLYRQYRERGLVVLGFPCDQFGGQEPDDEAEIQKFCTQHYDVTFPLFAKVEVNGARTHPLYRLLKGAAKGFLGTRSIKWNFTKFLVDRVGNVVGRYAPTEKPEKLARKIEPLLR
jgi:glutathione peroxidase